MLNTMVISLSISILVSQQITENTNFSVLVDTKDVDIGVNVLILISHPECENQNHTDH